MRWLRALLGARDEGRPAVGVDPDHGNLFSLAERRSLRELQALTPRLCRYCGGRPGDHDTNCVDHSWSRYGFDNGDKP